jgi:putative multiple sugar transport system substrate-binding protein
MSGQFQHGPVEGVHETAPLHPRLGNARQDPVDEGMPRAHLPRVGWVDLHLDDPPHVGGLRTRCEQLPQGDDAFVVSRALPRESRGDRAPDIDGSQLGTQLKAAKDAGATVIAYDRLVKNTAAVDYYVAYDNFKVGVLQGNALLEGLKAKKPNGPYNIELFAGSPDDANAQVFFDGAMSVLTPKIADGTLKVVSGQKDFAQVVTQGWKAENAQRRMDTLLAANYSATDLDGVLSPNDTLARAILTSVKATGKANPVVTGQDSEVESVKSIMEGVQYSTINKDTRNLVKATIEMVQAITKGGKPTVNDEKSYNNGVKVVPSYLLEPVSVNLTNYEEILVGSGYYTADQLK